MASLFKITRRQTKLLLTLLTLLLIANITSVPTLQLGAIASFIWLGVIMPVLGWLLLKCFIKKTLNIVEGISYSLALGLGIYLVSGIVLNVLGATLHLHIFNFKYVVPFIDIIYLAITLYFLGTYEQGSYLSLIKRLKPNYILTFIPILFPILAVLGSVNLNNNGSGVIALVSLGVILCFQIIIIVRMSKKELDLIPIVSTIFFTSLAMILSISMRSNYLMGSDINQEFRAFQGTIANGFWSPHLFPGSPYNACLSITILPAFLKGLIPISDIYLFKFSMQLVLAYCPIIIMAITYNLFKKPKYAYLTALFYLIQFQFLTEFPALIRQQAAIFFFGAIFLTLTTKAFSHKQRNLLFLFFGIMMILSHYSTSYVGVTLLLLTWLVDKFIVLLRGGSHYSYSTLAPPITGIIVLLLIVFTWNVQITQASGGIGSKLISSVASIGDFLKADSRSGYLDTSLGITQQEYTTQTIDTLASSTRSPNGYQAKGYTPIPLSSLAPAPQTTVEEYIYKLSSTYIPALIKLVTATGVAWILIQSIRKKNTQQFSWIAASSLLLVMIIALPKISADYNFERLYQQLLTILSVAIVGCLTLATRFKFINKRIGYIAMGVLLVFYFSATSGFIDQLAFGISNVNLADKGDTYDHFYVSASDFATIKWASDNLSGKTIKFDSYSLLHSYAYSGNRYYQAEGVLPEQVNKNLYVFASTANIIKGLAFDSYQGRLITYNFPLNFYSTNKDLIYSNNSSRIYK